MEQPLPSGKGTAHHQPSALLGFVDDGTHGLEGLPGGVSDAVRRPLHRHGLRTYNPVAGAVAEACRDAVEGCGGEEGDVEVDAVAARKARPALAIVACDAQPPVVECLGESFAIKRIGLVGGLGRVAVGLDRQALDEARLVGGKALAQLGRYVEIIAAVAPQVHLFVKHGGHHHQPEPLHAVAADAVGLAHTGAAGGCAQSGLPGVDVDDIVIGRGEVFDASGGSEGAVVVAADAEADAAGVGRAECQPLVAQDEGGPEGRPVAALLRHHMQFAAYLLGRGMVQSLPVGLVAVGVGLVEVAPPFHCGACGVYPQLDAEARQCAVVAAWLQHEAELQAAFGIDFDYLAHGHCASFGAGQFQQHVHLGHPVGLANGGDVTADGCGLQVVEALPGTGAIGVDKVVERGGTPEVPAQRTAQQLLPFVFIACDVSVVGVDAQREEVFAAYRGLVLPLVVSTEELAHRYLGQLYRVGGAFDTDQLKLVVAVLAEGPRGAGVVGVVHLVAVAGEVEPHKEPFAGHGVELRHAEVEAAALACGQGWVYGVAEQAVAERGEDAAFAHKVARVAEIEAIVKHVVRLSFGVGVLCHLEALVHFLQLVGMGVGDTEAAHHPIGAESIVVLHSGQAAQVAANGIPQTVAKRVGAVQRVAFVGKGLPMVAGVAHKTLVHPVPHKASLQRGVLVDGVPIVLQAAHAVAHGVAVFGNDIGSQRHLLCRAVGGGRFQREVGAAQSVGAFDVAVAFEVAPQPAPVGTIVGEVFHRRVHHLHDVGVPVQLGTLVGDGSGAVQPLEVAVGVFRRHPVAAFVAQRPGYHRGVVAVAVIHVVDAVLHRPAPFLLFGQAPFAVALGVALDIGLVPHVEAVAVA